MHAIRSLLSVPGNQARMLEKAPGLGADALMVDLEDSVPLARKAEARAMTRAFIEGGAGDAVTYVRVNSLDSGLFEDDLQAIVVPGLAGIQCPKVSSPEAIRTVDAALARLESEQGLPHGSFELIVGIESVAGVFHCHQILTAADRVSTCIVGVAENGDLQRDVGYTYSAEGTESLYIRSKVVLEARHAGIANPLDGVFSAIDDMEGFEAEASRARRLGYRGKKVIHPRQIESANRIFMPTPQEVDFHQRVLAAMETAEKEGRAATTVDGLMVDIAMVANAHRVLGWAGESGAS